MLSNYTLARFILGKNFISAEEIAASCGPSYTEDQLIELGKKLPDQATLEQLRNNGMMLVASPPTAMTLLDVRAQRAGFFYSKGLDQDDGGWYDESSEKFAKTDKVEALVWIAFRKESVEDSLSKNWQEQQALVQQPMVIPNASEVVWALTTYKAVRDVRLIENFYVRTSSVDLDGNHVYVGYYFVDEGLLVSSQHDDYGDDNLGVSAIRKF